MNIRCGPSTIDLLSATRSNLFTIRLAIKRYIQNNTYPPQPTSSTNTNSNKTKSHSLENILTNQGSFGDGTEYIQGSIPSEYLSDSFGNNFVCVVKDIHAYKKDQSKFQSCLNPHNVELPNYSNGYVYFSRKGLIRLNFKVTGDDFMKGKQQKLSQLENISIQPTTNENTVVHNYPVQW
ncbi:MAG: hypothetical protein KC646_15750 [Candidatus Cloacimonetes bacterium]|nr:hypothetical protein [Candidatus Cloacimonadota bacterium]